MSHSGDRLPFGAVVIGRNEGGRLKECLASLDPATTAIYVDSGLSDGSVDWARRHGADVVELDTSRPFTAARAMPGSPDCGRLLRVSHLCSSSMVTACLIPSGRPVPLIT